MKTLLIYDNAGTIYYQQTGYYALPDGLPYIEAEIPAGYYAVSVDTGTKEPVLAEFPKSETDQRLAALEAQLAAMTGAE
ncbi:MAG TPA: hypothetical protein IAB55_06385 [Candidatus Merdivicinus faecavium]|nr:hypothetical protein [Candidatus Merdivicinus faecavium]